jgi:hypothetical protein
MWEERGIYEIACGMAVEERSKRQYQGVIGVAKGYIIRKEPSCDDALICKRS